MILGTAGHIDHGKTSLVRALTGIDTDRLPEEKRRGITIELGFAPLRLDGVGTIGIVDVPGHEAFVRTMVAGATGIDLALVVIAADEGVMPQTREHLAILGLLGVRRGVIALTKSDLVDQDWLALVTEDVRAAVGGVLGDVAVVPTSVISGAGLDDLRAALIRVAKTVPGREDEDLFRLPVDRSFTIKGTGTVVTGTVWSGVVAREDTVRILPGGLSARVRGIQAHSEQVDRARTGSRAAVALAGVDVDQVPRGAVLATDPEWQATKLARADVELLPGAERLVRPRSWIRFHVGTSDVGVRVVGRPQPGIDRIAARLVFDTPVVLRAGDRFILRGTSPLNTLGGGTVVDPYAPKRPKMWPVAAPLADRLRLAVDEAGPAGLDLKSLPVRFGVRPTEGPRAIKDAGLTVRDERAFKADAAAVVAHAVGDAIRQYQHEHPLEIGMPLQLLRARVKASQSVVDSVLKEQEGAGVIAMHGSMASLAGWTPTPSPAQAEQLTRIMELLTTTEPPSLDELSTALKADVTGLLRYLERGGRVIEVERGRYYEKGRLEAVIGRLRSAMKGGAEHSPSELREALGLSRKFLIPLLEYADRQGFTRRGAAGRTWVGEASSDGHIGRPR